MLSDTRRAHDGSSRPSRGAGTEGYGRRLRKEEAMVTGVRRAARLLGTALGLAALISMAGLAAAQAPWTAPAGEKEKKNPLPADAQTIEQGRKVAQINCVTCHGAKGKGDGAAAVALNLKPADWTSKA